MRDADYNANAANIDLILAVLCAGLYPNVAISDAPPAAAGGRGGGRGGGGGQQQQLKLRTREGQVTVHPASVNYGLPQFPSKFAIFHEKVRWAACYSTIIPLYTTHAPLGFAACGSSERSTRLDSRSTCCG